VSGRPDAIPISARGCRCGSGAIPYVEDGLASCAKCGHAVEPPVVDLDVRAPLRLEDRTGCTPPGPSPEPAAHPIERDRGRPTDAEPPPAPSLAPHAGSGPSFDWPFGAGSHARAGRDRSGGGA
jgi:hypothetical protein